MVLVADDDGDEDFLKLLPNDERSRYREACSFLCCFMFSVLGSNDAIEECSIGLNITYQYIQCMMHHTASPFCTNIPMLIN